MTKKHQTTQKEVAHLNQTDYNKSVKQPEDDWH